jgi:hypothetical protein
LTSICKECGCEFKLTCRGTPGECSGCRKERERKEQRARRWQSPEQKRAKAAQLRAQAEELEREADSPLGVIAPERRLG